METNLSHDRIQQECYLWLWNKFPQTRRLCWHTPNEQRLHPGETKRMFFLRLSQAKAIGVTKGIWDLVFYWKGVLYIFDIKIGNDRLSDEQKEFQKQVEENGGYSYCISSLQDFQNIVLTLPL